MFLFLFLLKPEKKTHYHQILPRYLKNTGFKGSVVNRAFSFLMEVHLKLRFQFFKWTDFQFIALHMPNAH